MLSVTSENKMDAQTDIQFFFQLLHEPVEKKENAFELMEQNSLCRIQRSFLVWL
jgi:hypothetical protein